MSPHHLPSAMTVKRARPSAVTATCHAICSDRPCHVPDLLAPRSTGRSSWSPVLHREPGASASAKATADAPKPWHRRAGAGRALRCPLPAARREVRNLARSPQASRAVRRDVSAPAHGFALQHRQPRRPSPRHPRAPSDGQRAICHLPSAMTGQRATPSAICPLP